MHWNEISNEDDVFLLCINLIFVFSASIADKDTLLDDIYLIKVDSGPCKYIGVLSSLNKELFLKFVLENDFNFWIKNEDSIIGFLNFARFLGTCVIIEVDRIKTGEFDMILYI